MNRYDFLALEVLKAWIEPDHKNPRTLHHRGHGVFMGAGDIISLAIAQKKCRRLMLSTPRASR
jgi:hypothetical protein